MAANQPLGTVSAEGIQVLLKDIDKYSDRVKAAIGHELLRSAQKIVRDAKVAAPKDQGRLAREITYAFRGETKYSVISASEISAFREFGTGRKARIPAAYSGIASQFRGIRIGGNGTAKQNIYAWCKRQGIAKKFWYLIYKSILRNGTKPQPFFFPSYEAEIPQLEARLKKVIETQS